MYYLSIAILHWIKVLPLQPVAWVHTQIKGVPTPEANGVKFAAAIAMVMMIQRSGQCLSCQRQFFCFHAGGGDVFWSSFMELECKNEIAGQGVKSSFGTNFNTNHWAMLSQGWQRQRLINPFEKCSRAVTRRK